jgi:hypothetical protein
MFCLRVYQLHHNTITQIRRQWTIHAYYCYIVHSVHYNSMLSISTNKCTQLSINFISMLPCCIVIDFFLSNQPDAPIIQIYSVTKLYMFRASSLSIIRSFLLYIRHWLSSILTLLGSGHQKPA